MNLNVKLYLDCADLTVIRGYASREDITGSTTNPTLARKAGVTDYVAFCRETASIMAGKPVSFEVFAEDTTNVIRQAKALAALAPNVYVKVPVVNTEGVAMTEAVRALSHDGVKVNVTAVFTHAQAFEMCTALKGGAPSILSMFAGRIADAGVDPVPHVAGCVSIAHEIDKNIEVLWASPREILNVLHAQQAGCSIITLTPDLLTKMRNFGKSLSAFSLETVRMLTGDALSAGYAL